LQRGVNGSEFKTLGKLHILRVADAKPTTPRFRYRSNEGQYGFILLNLPVMYLLMSDTYFEESEVYLLYSCAYFQHPDAYFLYPDAYLLHSCPYFRHPDACSRLLYANSLHSDACSGNSCLYLLYPDAYLQYSCQYLLYPDAYLRYLVCQQSLHLPDYHGCSSFSVQSMLCCQAVSHDLCLAKIGISIYGYQIYPQIQNDKISRLVTTIAQRG